MVSIFKYTTHGETSEIDFDDIVYMKNNKRIIEIYSYNKIDDNITLNIKFYSTINDVIAKLPSDRFAHCERSYIVNLDYVSTIQYSLIILNDNEKTQIPISRAKRSKTVIAFQKNKLNS